MMHLETLLMGDEEIAEKFVQAQTPAEAMTLSCEVKNFQQSIWDANCDRVVEDSTFMKLS